MGNTIQSTLEGGLPIAPVRIRQFDPQITVRALIDTIKLLVSGASNVAELVRQIPGLPTYIAEGGTEANQDNQEIEIMRYLTEDEFPVPRRTYLEFVQDATRGKTNGCYFMPDADAKANIKVFEATDESLNRSIGPVNYDKTLGVMVGNWYYSPIPVMYTCRHCYTYGGDCHNMAFFDDMNLQQLVHLDVDLMSSNGLTRMAALPFLVAFLSSSQAYLINHFKQTVLINTTECTVSIGLFAFIYYKGDKDRVAKVQFWRYERSALKTRMVKERDVLFGKYMTHAVLLKY